MPTSGSADFGVTREDIIRDALLTLGAIDADEDPTPRETQDASRMLNMLMKSLQANQNLWLKKDVTHTLIPGTTSYTVGTGLNVNTPRPLRLASARRKDTSSREVPIEVGAREDYASLPTKTTQGAPNLVYYDPQRDNGVLYVWPTGDTVNNQLVLTFKRPIEDFDTAGNSPDCPQEWFLCLVFGLAELLLPQYPTSQAAFIQNKAGELLAGLMQFDEEAVPFTVTTRRY